LFSFSQRSSDPEGSPMTGPYISTTTTTQIDEPDSPTTRTPIMRGPQAPLTSTSPISSTTYTPFTIPPHQPHQPHQPHYHSGDVNTAQSTADFGSLHGKRPEWVGHGRSVSGGSARSGSSAATLTTRDDPNAFSGTPLVKNASAEGRSGYPYVYRRERSGSEGSIQYQAGNASPSGDSNSSQRVQKALPSLPAGSQ